MRRLAAYMFMERQITQQRQLRKAATLPARLQTDGEAPEIECAEFLNYRQRPATPRNRSLKKAGSNDPGKCYKLRMKQNYPENRDRSRGATGNSLLSTANSVFRALES